MTALRTVDDHLALVLSGITPLVSETLTIDAAHGRTLSAPVHAAVGIPAFDNSAMDGFAVHADDVAGASPEHPVVLRIVGDLPAGTSDDPDVPRGATARIMTGAPIPGGIDTVVPWEDTRPSRTAGAVEVVHAPRRRGAHVRRAGEDARPNDVIVDAGSMLGARQLAAAAASGIDRVAVTRTPRVAVVSTGSELAEPGGTLRRGEIPESNSRMLAALAAEAGGAVVHRSTVPDDAETLARLVTGFVDAAAAVRPDLVVLSGGVGAGTRDVVKQALSDRMEFAHVALQPGRPQGFGRAGTGMLLFGLPGNPVSAAVSFEVFVRPAMMRLLGRTTLHRPAVRLPAAVGWRARAGVCQYVPVAIDRATSAWRVLPLAAGGSHRAAALARAGGYAVLPAEVEVVHAGDEVDVLLLGGDG